MVFTFGKMGIIIYFITSGIEIVMAMEWAHAYRAKRSIHWEGPAQWR